MKRKKQKKRNKREGGEREKNSNRDAYFDAMCFIKNEPVVVNGMDHAFERVSIVPYKGARGNVHCLLSQFHRLGSSLSLACDTSIPSSNLCDRLIRTPASRAQKPHTRYHDHIVFTETSLSEFLHLPIGVVVDKDF